MLAAGFLFGCMGVFVKLGAEHFSHVEMVFYRSFFGREDGRMESSASADLLRWERASKEYGIVAADSYTRRRDPFVFWIPERGEFGCVMTMKMKGRPEERAGGRRHAGPSVHAARCKPGMAASAQATSTQRAQRAHPARRARAQRASRSRAS